MAEKKIEYSTAICPICGQGFQVRIGGRGRPKEYDTDNCRYLKRDIDLVRSRLLKLKAHGLTETSQRGMYQTLYALTNRMNPRSIIGIPEKSEE